MNGAELARHVETRHPELPIVLITGYADTKALQEARNWPIISKPFMADQLATALRDILGRQPPASNVVPIKK
jgi:DNA-binding NtrC family response regulator